MRRAHWRCEPSPTAQERGDGLSRTGSVTLLRNSWGVGLESVVGGSSPGAEYHVLVRWPGSRGACCMCSCPDDRQGYCKHAAATLTVAKAARAQSSAAPAAPAPRKRPAWMLAAYSSSSSAAAEPEPRAAEARSEAAEAWLAQLRRVEAHLVDAGAEGCRSLLADAVERSAMCGSLVSQLLGGSDAASESYQAMPATLLFDTLAKIRQERNEPVLRWCLLYLHFDAALPFAKRLLLGLGAPAPADADASANAKAKSTTLGKAEVKDDGGEDERHEKKQRTAVEDQAAQRTEAAAGDD